MTTTRAVTGELVRFTSEGRELRGELFRPADHGRGERLPAVVVSGTWTSVRQQMADRYARAMAGRGYAALSFDFTGYGASEESRAMSSRPR